ncbi:hypothetical protein B7463_g11642, partial [Scytalidium lignicola]
MDKLCVSGQQSSPLQILRRSEIFMEPAEAKEYDVSAVPVRGIVGKALFSSRHVEWHDRNRRLVNSAFSMTQAIRYEPWVNENITLFIEQMRNRFVAKTELGATMNLMEWATYFAFEGIHVITFGERVGYIEEGRDVNGVIANVKRMVDWFLYTSRVTIIDQLTLKNPIFLWLNKHGWFDPPNPFMPILKHQFFERQEHWKGIKGRPADRDTLNDLFLKTQQEHPEVTDFRPITHSMSVVGAGVEATAITICSIFYSLLKNRRCYTKLKEELNSQLGDSTDISFTVAQSLPYLNAVIHESMRCHMVTRLPFTRETPADGLTICGIWVLPGISVGVYEPVVHRNKEIFGDDVDVFRPERWLDDKEKAKQMANTLFHFGYGKYSCLGNNIARLEILKLIQSVLREFDLSLVEPDKDWILENGAFSPPVELKIKLQPRNLR